MRNIYEISTAKGKHIGSILCDRIEKDSVDNYLLFMIGNETVAMIACENICVSTSESRASGRKVEFTEYQSNRV